MSDDTHKDNSGPAHPAPCSTFKCDQGLTKREWFVGMALAGRGKEWDEEGFGYDKIAQHCFVQADFMIEASKK